MSIVRVGLAESKKFAEGYEAIFGKKKKAAEPTAKDAAKQEAPEAVSEAKKKPAKKKSS